MDLHHRFTVSASPADTWKLLTDIPRVARCMPGAAIDEGTRDPYTGGVKMKVGAVTVQMRGEIHVTEMDDANHRLRMSAAGSDPRGGSGAQAGIAMELADAGPGSTEVSVTTTLQLSGKVAQFGQGMLEDVSNAILQKFVSNLERDLRAERSGEEPGGTASSGTTTGASAAADDNDTLDLGAAVLPAMLRRYGTVALGAAGLLVGLWALIRSFRDPYAGLLDLPPEQ